MTAPTQAGKEKKSSPLNRRHGIQTRQPPTRGEDAAKHRTPPHVSHVDDILKPHEAAEFMRVSVRTLADWRLDNVGPAYIKLGIGRSAHIRYRRRALLDYMVANERQTTQVAAATA